MNEIKTIRKIQLIPQKGKLKFLNIRYKSWFTLDKASIGQLILLLTFVNKESKDIHLIHIIQHYHKMLKYETLESKNIRLWTLIYDLPSHVRNSGINNNDSILFEDATKEKILNILRDRINYFLTRKDPDFGHGDKEKQKLYLKELETVKNEIKILLNIINKKSN